jgi:hypothetical protein
MAREMAFKRLARLGSNRQGNGRELSRGVFHLDYIIPGVLTESRTRRSETGSVINHPAPTAESSYAWARLGLPV